MSTQTAENRSQTTWEPLPAALVDHDALYEAVKRLLRNGRVMVHHVEVGSADVHRDLAGMRAALDAAEQLLNPQLPEAPDDAMVLYARAVRVNDEVSLPTGVWAIVRAVHPHELYPDTHIQLHVGLPDGLPDTVGYRLDAVVVVRRPEPPADLEPDQ